MLGNFRFYSQLAQNGFQACRNLSPLESLRTGHCLIHAGLPSWRCLLVIGTWDFCTIFNKTRPGATRDCRGCEGVWCPEIQVSFNETNTSSVSGHRQDGFRTNVGHPEAPHTLVPKIWGTWMSSMLSMLAQRHASTIFRKEQQTIWSQWGYHQWWVEVDAFLSLNNPGSVDNDPKGNSVHDC